MSEVRMDVEKDGMPSSRPRPPDSLEAPTPMAISRRDTLKALAAVRVAQERRTLTIISGPNAGQVFVLSTTAHILGRGDTADVRVGDPDVSRAHARIDVGDDGRTHVQDLGSTNGTFVGGARVTRAELLPGARLQVGPNLILRYSVTDDIEEELHRRMYESSTRDVLTRAFNRRYFVDRLVAEVAHARRHRQPLAVLMFDLDHFKRVNDTHGHVIGDILLRAVAARVSRSTRLEDVFARWGGDEFVILARTTDRAEAARLAERIRTHLAELEVPADGAPIRVSVSVGLVSLSELRPEAKADELLATADRRLGAAKMDGRDRVRGDG